MILCSVANCGEPSFATIPLTSHLPVLGPVSFDAALCQNHLDDVTGRGQKFSVEVVDA